MNAHPFVRRIREGEYVVRAGQVRRILPTYLEADGPAAPLGSLCRIETVAGSASDMIAEVAGVHADSIVLVPLRKTAPTFPGARVVASGQTSGAPVGDGFLGRAVDAFGDPIDGGPPICADASASVLGAPTPPLERVTPNQVLETGLRALDGLLTIGLGQRVGLFAAAGVGKTTLLSQLARQTPADRCILCLVGERGREIEAAWSNLDGSERRKKITLVAAASDQTAALRVRTADYALALAEHWRSRGLNVVLLLDSATRLAMATREVGLAAGEPPTVRAYTPGVFAALPRLVERCGALRAGGSITAFLTVLTETDDVDDPIAELMKSILDGHIVLSRAIAEQGLFPAIDAPRSVSRSAPALLDDAQRPIAQRALSMLSTYETSRTLIEAGVYVKGANSEIDLAIERRPALLAFLRQGANERSSLAETRRALAEAVGAARFAP